MFIVLLALQQIIIMIYHHGHGLKLYTVFVSVACTLPVPLSAYDAAEDVIEPTVMV